MAGFLSAIRQRQSAFGQISGCRMAPMAFPPSALRYYRAAPGLIVSNVPTIVRGKESVEVIMVPVRTHNEPDVSAGS